MGNVIVYIVLALVIAGAVYGTVKRVRHGSACCGEHEAAPKKIRVSDKNKKNYQYLYEYELTACTAPTVPEGSRINSIQMKACGLWQILARGRLLLEAKGFWTSLIAGRLFPMPAIRCYQ